MRLAFIFFSRRALACRCFTYTRRVLCALSSCFLCIRVLSLPLCGMFSGRYRRLFVVRQVERFCCAFAATFVSFRKLARGVFIRIYLHCCLAVCASELRFVGRGIVALIFSTWFCGVASFPWLPFLCQLFTVFYLRFFGTYTAGFAYNRKAVNYVLHNGGRGQRYLVFARLGL